jgi:hypothetical protein
MAAKPTLRSPLAVVWRLLPGWPAANKRGHSTPQGSISGTVEKYGAQLIGDGSAITAYRVNGEILTKLRK